MRMKLVLAVCVYLATLTAAQPAADEIQDLPGLKKQPYWKQYSGYLQAGGTRKLHYWFLESASNPSSDPVVLWLNGGPGCSSDLGLLTEHGPFRIESDGHTVKMNPYSWNTVANMLYLEAPAGVGYSYAEDGNYTTDDDQTAHDNYLALQDFFKKFSKFAKNEFFITGESYGGIYVPTLSALVVEDKSMNFQGFAVGNGLSNGELNDDSLMYFVYYHGLIGEVQWNTLLDVCCKGESDNCTFTKNARTNPKCAEKVSEVQLIAWSGGLNVYNLYGPCAGGAGTKYDPIHKTLVTGNFGWSFSWLPQVKQERQFIEKILWSTPGRVSVTPPCIDATAPLTYMNWDAVRSALHIPSQLGKWTVCSDILQYHRTYSDVSAEYHKVLKAGKRILVYNGDVDMACNFLGDQWFVDRLNVPVVRDRAEWYFEDEAKTKQVAGFVKQFQGISVVTVRGAGHMVPTDKPRPALKMFISFITNKPF